MRIDVMYLGENIAVDKIEYSFYRNCKKNGRPSTQVFFGGANITFLSNASGLRFMEEVLRIDKRFKEANIADPTEEEVYKPVIIRVYDSEGYKIREIELIDAHVNLSKENFEAFQEHKKNLETSSMTMQIQFVSAIQRINGRALNVFRWHLSDYKLKEEYKPVQNSDNPEEEKTDFKFTAHFERLDDYNGEFGFDWMRDNYVNICENDSYNKLKKEYSSFTIHEEDYFVPSLSMLPKQKNVKLKLIIKEKEGTITDQDIIKFPEEGNVEFKLEGEKISEIKVSEIKGKTITVFYKSALSADVTIKLSDKNEEKVGAIKIVENKPLIDLPLNLVLVSESRHITKLKEKYGGGYSTLTISILEKELQNNSLNQAFIKPYFTNNLDTAPIISLDDFNEGDITKEGRKKIIKKYQNSNISEKKGISLLLISKNHISSKAGDCQLVPLDFNAVCMYLSTAESGEIIHEIGHALGLTHSFEEDKQKRYYKDRDQEGVEKLAKNKIDLEKQEGYLKKSGISENNKQMINNNIGKLKKMIKTQNDRFSIGDKNPYKFNKRETTCYMDYYNDKKDFYKWQWDVMYKEAKKYYSL